MSRDRFDERATDYAIAARDAKELLGAVVLPHEFRRMAIDQFAKSRGVDALVELFSQFIGLANSVVANNRDGIELILITEGGLHPHQAEKANLPTIFGALNGIKLAEGLDQTKVCGGCAFRLGSHANQSPATTCDADWCSNPGEVDFMCHEHLDKKGEPTRKCMGFTQSRRRRA